MSQTSLPLLPRTDTARPDEETGVLVAWALDGGRPVHIGRYSHLRDCEARPELTCLGCDVAVVPVLPPQQRGRPGRQDHFRHKQVSPRCWAHHGQGAQLWNVVLHLHDVLTDLAATPFAQRLALRAPCDPTAGAWSHALPLFASGCSESTRRPLPAWSQVRLTPTRRGVARVPDLRFFLHDTEVFRLACVPPDPVSALQPLPDESVPRAELHVDDGTAARALRWDPPSDQDLPVTRLPAALAWRCPRHR